jgi:hypothetical protein
MLKLDVEKASFIIGYFKSFLSMTLSHDIDTAPRSGLGSFCIVTDIIKLYIIYIMMCEIREKVEKLIQKRKNDDRMTITYKREISKEEKLKISMKDNNRKYYLKNREKKREYQKRYDVLNRESIRARISKIDKCECGRELCHGDMARHKRSPIHLKLMNLT